MFVGFDYGTSNCAMAQVQHGQATLIPLYEKNVYDKNVLVPSTLYAADRALIADSVWQQMPGGNLKNQYGQERQTLLQLARVVKMDLSLGGENTGVVFGEDAISQYMDNPTEGYFIKSPKSFLGASGLRQQLVDFFEDVVAAMMLNIKRRAEIATDQVITHTVIGRPVNFQGICAESSNRQAQAILLAAGRRAGFNAIEFLYEPLAAGFDFETRLTSNRVVLIVDVGGGTTDCSMVLMGPDHIAQSERRQDFLGHSGERVGGNDFDIQLALNAFMPEFGLTSTLKNNLPMPRMPFVNAMATNDVGAQADFYSDKTQHLLTGLARDTLQPREFQRFLTMRENKLNMAVVREAEKTKIALSSSAYATADLSNIDPGLDLQIQTQQLANSSAGLLVRIQNLINEVVRQAERKPDLVYVTGGSAKSPLIREAIKGVFGEEIAVVDGDHFGSVVSGLAIWGERLFRG